MLRGEATSTNFIVITLPMPLTFNLIAEMCGSTTVRNVFLEIYCSDPLIQKRNSELKYHIT